MLLKYHVQMHSDDDDQGDDDDDGDDDGVSMDESR